MNHYNLQFFRRSQMGFERIQLVYVSVFLVILIILFGPSVVKKIHGESDLRMKKLLRAFHTASSAYQTHHPEEGYAETVQSLVRDKTRPYLSPNWLELVMEGFSLVYNVPERPPRANFSLKADKTFPLRSSFCIDQKGVLRAATASGQSAPLTADSLGCHGGIEVV